jgi:hypothetical protein
MVEKKKIKIMKLMLIFFSLKSRLDNFPLFWFLPLKTLRFVSIIKSGLLGVITTFSLSINK